ncbi:unnamed protein product, partial [Ectocarpus sp. 8 AP-2014]
NKQQAVSSVRKQPAASDSRSKAEDAKGEGARQVEEQMLLEKSVVPSRVSRNERGGGCRPPGAEAERAMRSRGQTTQRACQPEAKDVTRRRSRRTLS